MSVAIAIMTLVATTCFADIPKSDLNIGGINPGQSMDYVVQVYGKPGEIEKADPFQIYNYNYLFVVIGREDNGLKVFSVAIYEKGLKTPKGFTVGMPFEKVVKEYGKVEPFKFKAEGIESNLKNCKDYTYFSEDWQMVFLVDKKGVIRGIRVEEIDEEKLNKLDKNAEKKERQRETEEAVTGAVTGVILNKVFDKIGL